MMRYFKLAKELILVLAVLVLIGCGGSSSGSGTTQAGTEEENGGEEVTTDTSSQEIALASKETAAQILISESDIGGINMLVSAQSVISKSGDTGDVLSGSSKGTKSSYTVTGSGSTEGDCGGTMSWTSVSSIDDETVYPFTCSVDYLLEDFCLDTGVFRIIYNGTIELDIEESDSDTGTTTLGYYISYTSNIPDNTSGSVTYYEMCNTVDGAESCSPGVYASETSTFTTSGVQVSANASSGFDLTYTMEDSQGQTFSIVLSGVTLCSNGNIGSGSGTVSYGSEVISVEFTNCEEFVVTYNGNSSAYNQ